MVEAMEGRTGGPSRVTLEVGEGSRERSAEEIASAVKTEMELASTQNQPDSTHQEQSPVENEKEALLAGKFKTTEDLEKAYTELQSKLGSTSKEETSAETSEETSTETKAESALDNKLFDQASTEWNDTGEVTEATIKSLVDAGVPEVMINQYIENANASEQLKRQDILTSVGGEKAFDKLSNWAQSNLPKDQIDGFNAVIATGDIGQIKLVIGSLQAQMGSTSFINPDASPSHNGQSFGSKAEMVAAINDPRYNKDSGYRTEVMQKLGRSPNI